MKPAKEQLCWVYFDNGPCLSRVTHTTNCFYYCTNVNSFIDSKGLLCMPGELGTIPPGHRNETFRPYSEGQPAPAFNPKTGKPADMKSNRPTPLF